MLYEIFHPLNGILNTDCKRGVYEYEKLNIIISASSLQDAFIKSQNGFNKHYAKLNKRSTSVGDIIRVNRVGYMITGSDFVEIPDTVLTYIDWSNH